LITEGKLAKELHDNLCLLETAMSNDHPELAQLNEKIRYVIGMITSDEALAVCDTAHFVS